MPVHGDIWFKKLSRNDVGETGGKQSGPYVPVGDHHFFEPMDFASNNHSRPITVRDEFGKELKWLLHWYRKPEGGKEFHITRCANDLASKNYASGDVLSLQRINSEEFILLPKSDSDIAESNVSMEVTRIVKGSPSLGQGFQQDIEAKLATEQRAMTLAMEYFEARGWRVVDTSSTCPFDLECYREQECLTVEVKGTTGSGSKVLLTKNEVHVFNERYPATALVVVSGIVVRRDANGTVTARNGTIEVCSPWAPEEERLQAISYEYRRD